MFSYACIIIGQGFIRRYISTAVYSFKFPFRETEFGGVSSCGVFDKLGCAAGKKTLRNTDIEDRDADGRIILRWILRSKTALIINTTSKRAQGSNLKERPTRNRHIRFKGLIDF
jgi:hypothetical protein